MRQKGPGTVGAYMFIQLTGGVLKTSGQSLGGAG